VSIDAELGAGSLSAKVGKDGEGQHIDAELTDLDLQQLGLGSFVGAPLKGTASGTVSLVLPDDALKSSGNIELKVAGLHIGDGKAKIKAPGMPSGLTLDEVDAGTFELALQTQEGVSTLSRFSSNGRDLKVSGSGTVRLGNPLRLSRPDLILELKFSDAYKNKSDRTKSLFEILGLQPEWRRALAPDGAIRLRLGGILGAPRVAPSAIGPTTGAHGKGKAHTR
jgi:type II secretion system protein N